MKETIKLGIIGLGGRSMGLLDLVFLNRNDVEVAAVCDLYADRREAAANRVEQMSGKRPFATQRYEEIMTMAGIDAVFIGTSWAAHIDIAIAAMEAGKYAACEVGGAYSLRSCWRLVEAYERTNVPCMMMENCCYGRDEMMALNMAKLGVFGEIVHCSGG
ncbi:Gfo/Idh/MocA family protein [Paenibacillus aurantiacus]|uniref:Gfo/Idh/MocA family protein n=1 Tax=Paenibacillus aurantiacus TaxID=1936118 RepID=A0ABV5KU88_9BACL